MPVVVIMINHDQTSSNKTALVLAAHGSRHAPEVYSLVDGYAEQIRQTQLFNEVVAAYHDGSPPFSQVLDGLESERVIVVPFMTSAGYYSKIVLPRELALNQTYHPARVTITKPVGTHPGMIKLVSRRFERNLQRLNLSADQTTLAIVGHGTTRHPHSRLATSQLVSTLQRQGIFPDVIEAYLDEQPSVETILVRARLRNIIVIPFTMTPGPHTRKDIPARLGFSTDHPCTLPVDRKDGDRLICVDDALGTESAIMELIMDLAQSATKQKADLWRGDHLRCA